MSTTYYIRVNNNIRISLHPATRTWTTYWYQWNTGVTYIDLDHIDDNTFRCLATDLAYEDLVMLTLQGAILTDISSTVVSIPDALSLSLNTRILR